MSDLETAVRPHLTPLVQGHRQELDQDAQAVIAYWCVKTAMVLDLINGSMGIHPELRKSLYAERGPPPGSHVWLAAIEPDNVAANHFIQPLELPTPDLGYTGLPNSYGATLAIGHLAINLWGTMQADRHATLTEGLASRFRLIEPFQGTFVWPPGPALTRAEYAVVSRAWEKS